MALKTLASHNRHNQHCNRGYCVINWKPHDTLKVRQLLLVAAAAKLFHPNSVVALRDVCRTLCVKLFKFHCNVHTQRRLQNLSHMAAFSFPFITHTAAAAVVEFIWLTTLVFSILCFVIGKQLRYYMRKSYFSK